MKSKIKVYIASHYSRKLEVMAAAYDLEKLGIQVVSTWHKERQNPNNSLKDVSDTFKRYTAKRDIAELKSATHFVLFSLDPDALFTRGGHCVENGYALANNLPTLVVGPRQHIFHYMPGIKKVETWRQGIKWLVSESESKHGKHN